MGYSDAVSFGGLLGLFPAHPPVSVGHRLTATGLRPGPHAGAAPPAPPYPTRPSLWADRSRHGAPPRTPAGASPPAPLRALAGASPPVPAAGFTSCAPGGGFALCTPGGGFSACAPAGDSTLALSAPFLRLRPRRASRAPLSARAYPDKGK
ncbi:hypothetical protein GCM10010510_61240 [Streptomyces anandii JCM 4720]|nr:hypothetical protein GCM10010510_61240 [Streptomyces anandii JCM 4720]